MGDLIQIQVRVVEDRVVGIFTSGFSLSTSKLYSNKEALARLRDASSDWKIVVPSIIAYLIEQYPDEAWGINVLVGQVVVRRFESTLTPVVVETSRRSRYNHGSR